MKIKAFISCVNKPKNAEQLMAEEKGLLVDAEGLLNHEPCTLHTAP